MSYTEPTGRFSKGKGIGALAGRYGWNAALWAILIATLLGILRLAFSRKLKPQAVAGATGSTDITRG